MGGIVVGVGLQGCVVVGDGLVVTFHLTQGAGAVVVGELEARVDSGEMALAVSLFPTTMDQLMAVSDAGAIMPPKSTWFEPKLRSGLLVHTFEGDGPG